jgi:RND family efflux transporter MFP subunit
MTSCMEKSMSRKFCVITLSAIFAGFMLLMNGCGKKTPPPPPPPAVTVSQPLQREVTDYLELTGNIQAVNTVQLVARVPGYLEKVLFRDGQRVRKGELLFRIQQNTYVSALEQAEGQVAAQKAQLIYAQSQLERYSSLLAERAASQTDVDNWRFQRDSAGANLKTAEANRELARLNLGYTQITAPFSGRIDRRLQDPGSLVGSGPNNTVLAQLTQIDPVYVYFSISDADLSKLRSLSRGLPGPATTNKWPVMVGLVKEDGYPHQGNLDFSATSLTSNTGTLLMRGLLSNPSGDILPGLYARVRVPVEKKLALLVPDSALSNDQQGYYVMTVNEKNIAERRNVKTGPLVDTMRVIEEGLARNERVIIKGLLKAPPGRQVTPVQDSAAAGAVSSPGDSGVKP